LGSGTLTISDGGVVTAGRGSIGYIGNGGVTVDGCGSEWNNLGRLYVASANGNGYLTVSNGGLVTADSVEIGLDGGVGSVTVTGCGGTFTVNNNLDIANNLGAGSLHLYDHAPLEIAEGGGSIVFGVGTGGSGTFTIGNGGCTPDGSVVGAGTITAD